MLNISIPLFLVRAFAATALKTQANPIANFVAETSWSELIRAQLHSSNEKSPPPDPAET
jgi:hypothetical protein